MGKSLFLYLKGLKAGCFGCFFQPHIFISSCRYKIKWFSPVTLSHVNLIIRPGEEPRRQERKCFPPLHYNLDQVHHFTYVILKTTLRGRCCKFSFLKICFQYFFFLTVKTISWLLKDTCELGKSTEIFLLPFYHITTVNSSTLLWLTWFLLKISQLVFNGFL